MEKTFTFTMTESQAKKFEKLLDATLEILTDGKKKVLSAMRGLTANTKKQ